MMLAMISSASEPGGVMTSKRQLVIQAKGRQMKQQVAPIFRLINSRGKVIGVDSPPKRPMAKPGMTPNQKHPQSRNVLASSGTGLPLLLNKSSNIILAMNP